MGDQLQLLDKLSQEQLIQFFRKNKNMISSIKNPKMFIRELKDSDLISNARYKTIMTKLGKGKGPDGIYDFLSWFEKTHKQDVRKFWECMFSEHICKKYPDIRSLRNKLLKAKNPNTQITKKVTKKRGMETKPNRAENTDGTKPGPSYTLPQPQAEPAEQPQLPDKELLVTCDEKKGTLHRDKLLKGIQCIYCDTPEGCWYLPSEFMKLAGRKKNNNWKTCIRHNNIPLQKLIEDGSLKCPKKMKRSSKVMKGEEEQSSAGPTV